MWKSDFKTENDLMLAASDVLWLSDDEAKAESAADRDGIIRWSMHMCDTRQSSRWARALTVRRNNGKRAEYECMEPRETEKANKQCLKTTERTVNSISNRFVIKQYNDY